MKRHSEALEEIAELKQASSLVDESRMKELESLNEEMEIEVESLRREVQSQEATMAELRGQLDSSEQAEANDEESTRNINLAEFAEYQNSMQSDDLEKVSDMFMRINDLASGWRNGILDIDELRRDLYSHRTSPDSFAEAYEGLTEVVSNARDSANDMRALMKEFREFMEEREE